MKKFEIPVFYRSSLLSYIKGRRKAGDPRKKDFSPERIDLGPVEFLIARHFGFCYGVENAIEIAYKAINENPGKKIFFLSEMIHNASVNNDLLKTGIKFILDNYGNQYIPWDEITKDDVVIIPAFGTTLEIETILNQKGINTLKYNGACPFVERVWAKAASLGKENYTIIIHGKSEHEETRAAFSHTKRNAPAVIVRNIDEARYLSKIILGEVDKSEFYKYFKDKYSSGFDVTKDLEKIGVVNQTTMLASETEAISALMKDTMLKKYGQQSISEHMADTNDTLCYATNDNQQSVLGLIETEADLAFVIGGYNSSNTTHLAELLEKKFNTYFISSAYEILSQDEIRHFDIHSRELVVTKNYLPRKEKVRIAITSGASCPDSIMEEVILKILSFYPHAADIGSIIQN